MLLSVVMLFTSCWISAGERTTEDFVHSESVFDRIYPVFLRLYPTCKSVHRPENKDVAGFVDVSPGYSLPSGKPVSDHSLTRLSFPLYCYNANREVEAQDSIRTLLVTEAERLWADPSYDETEEKAKLVAQLETFRDTASVLPSVYLLIDSKYGGNVRRYVDDLFRKSVLTNRRRLKRFVRSPSVIRMQRDMGFQFVVSKLTYRAWEAQGRSDNLIECDGGSDPEAGE